MALEVQEQVQRSTLAVLAGGVVGVASGVYNLAAAARSQVANGPRMLTQGACVNFWAQSTRCGMLTVSLDSPTDWASAHPPFMVERVNGLTGQQ